MVAWLLELHGAVEWHTRKPDGTPQKLLDVIRLTSLGWRAKISLQESIRNAYQNYLRKM